MFHMQLSKLVGVAQAAKKDGSLAAGKPSAKTMSMMERCEKPALWYRMERLKRHGLALAAVMVVTVCVAPGGAAAPPGSAALRSEARAAPTGGRRRDW